MNLRDLNHYGGCLLGGAIGDALGAPIEFMSLAEIRRRYGLAGVSGYMERNEQGLAEFTDDTQMTLFTAEGLLIAREHGAWTPTEAMSRAYLRWLRTQRGRPTGPTGDLSREGWLLGVFQMWKIRSPGSTCLTALGSGRKGSPENPINDSKGCGGVMRVAPVGLVFSGQAAFEQGCEAAALTHGHPSGYLSAGVFAQIIAELITGANLTQAIQAALASLARWPNNKETLYAVQKALDAVQNKPIRAETIEALGSGWVGEEALSIALYCALACPHDFRTAVLLSINHSGDSDSTGAMTGNLMGLMLGAEAIPADWLASIELRDEMLRIAQELV